MSVMDAVYGAEADTVAPPIGPYAKPVLSELLAKRAAARAAQWDANTQLLAEVCELVRVGGCAKSSPC